MDINSLLGDLLLDKNSLELLIALIRLLQLTLSMSLLLTASWFVYGVVHNLRRKD